MPTKSKSRSVTQTSALNRAAPAASVAAPIELDNILNGLNTEVTPLLELRAASPSSMVVSVGPISIVNPEFGFTKIVAPFSNVIPTYTGGTITFPTVSGGSATPLGGSAITITVSSGNFLKVGAYLNELGILVLLAGVQGASVAAALAPAPIASTFAIGHVVLRNVGGTIQTIQTSDIFQYVGGGNSNSNTYARIFMSM